MTTGDDQRATDDEQAADAAGASSEESSGDGIARSAGTVSGFTFLSRVLGLFREALMAAFFELSWVMDAFVFAYQIPNLFRKLFGEGALRSALIPVYTDYLQNKPRDETNRFASNVLNLLFLLLVLLTLAGVIFSFFVPDLFRGQAEADWLHLFSSLFRTMFPYMIVICLMAILGGLLNVHKHFAAPAAAPVLMNVVLLSVLCWLHVRYGNPEEPEQLIFFVAGAVLVGGLVQFLVQLPPLFGHGFQYSPLIKLDHPGLHRVLKLMGPSVLGLAVVQLNLVMDSVIAKGLVPESGAISALWFGNRVMQVPFALIGVAIATAAFPYFSDHAAGDDYDALSREVGGAVRMTLFLAIPSSIGLCVLARPTVRLLYEYQSFGPAATARTGSVLFYYATGIWAYCIYHVMTRAFYSVEDTKTPALVAGTMVVLNLALNIVLVLVMKQETGIALSTSLTSLVNISVLLWIFRGRYPSLDVGRLLWSFVRCTGLASVMGFAVYLTLVPFRFPAAGSLLYVIGYRTVVVLSAVFVGAVFYLGFSYLLRVPEVTLFLSRVFEDRSEDGDEHREDDGSTTGDAS